MIRFTLSSAGSQSITEVCETCEEHIRGLHVSEITTKHPFETGVVKIRDASNTLIVVKSKAEWVSSKSASYIRQGLLTPAEATKALASGKLYHGVRPQAMCSQSIDTAGGTTQSYCYRTLHPKFLAKYSASFHTASEQYNSTGSLVGMDRNGVIVRTIGEKPFGAAEVNTSFKGPDVKDWWKALSVSARNTYICKAQSCQNYINVYGTAVKDMSVAGTFTTEASFSADLTKYGCDGALCP